MTQVITKGIPELLLPLEPNVPVLPRLDQPRLDHPGSNRLDSMCVALQLALSRFMGEWSLIEMVIWNGGDLIGVCSETSETRVLWCWS